MIVRENIIQHLCIPKNVVEDDMHGVISPAANSAPFPTSLIPFAQVGEVKSLRSRVSWALGESPVSGNGLFRCFSRYFAMNFIFRHAIHSFVRISTIL